MGLLSTKWPVSFGRFILSDTLTSDCLEEAFRVSARSFSIPDHPEQEMKIHAPCGLLDPSAVVVGIHFLDRGGNTWVAVGTRTCSNSPSAAFVEAEFRRRAFDAYGDEWSLEKKSKLSRIRRAAKQDLAARTPFRLSEAGALFVCLQTGNFIVIGRAGIAVATDVASRIEVISEAAFPPKVPEFTHELLALLRSQATAAASVVPWPNGTASLVRWRGGELRETCSVQMLSWSPDSGEATILLEQGWRPIRIEVLWDLVSGRIGLFGRLESVTWPAKIEESDPHELLEARLGALVEMDQDVRTILSEYSTTPVLLSE